MTHVLQQALSICESPPWGLRHVQISQEEAGVEKNTCIWGNTAGFQSCSLLVCKAKHLQNLAYAFIFFCPGKPLYSVA